MNGKDERSIFAFETQLIENIYPSLELQVVDFYFTVDLQNNPLHVFYSASVTTDPFFLVCPEVASLAEARA